MAARRVRGILKQQPQRDESISWGKVFSLLDAGAETNQRDGDGKTLLHLAGESGDVNALGELLNSRGADVTATDNNGCCALDVAIEAGQVVPGARAVV